MQGHDLLVLLNCSRHKVFNFLVSYLINYFFIFEELNEIFKIELFKLMQLLKDTI